MNDQTEVSIKFTHKIDNEKKLKQYAETLKTINTFLTSIDTGKAKAVRFSTLEAICRELDCQPGDILEYTDGANLTLINTKEA
mgnify:CR=1 FL=1